MNERTLLVISNDKITRGLMREFQYQNNIIVVKDNSSSASRAIRLILRGRISVFAAIKMFAAENIRSNAPDFEAKYEINSNSELHKIYVKESPGRIILFRAGLIIRRQDYSNDCYIVNIHCAKVPSYGGLASIYRALRNRDYNQCATLHKVINRIDGGEVVCEKPYTLNPKISYKKNEYHAYHVGFDLLKEWLSK